MQTSVNKAQINAKMKVKISFMKGRLFPSHEVSEILRYEPEKKVQEFQVQHINDNRTDFKFDFEKPL